MEPWEVSKKADVNLSAKPESEVEAVVAVTATKATIDPEEPDHDSDDFEVEIEAVAISEASKVAVSNQPSTPPPTIDQLNENEEEDERIDFAPFIEKLAPSTRKILEEDYKAKFIHLIKPKKVKED